MSSIRVRLLVTLLLVFSLTWLLFTILTFFESKHEIEELFDAQLAQSAGVLSELTLHDIDELQMGQKPQLEEQVFGHVYEKKISFQIWSGNLLILSSASAPISPITFIDGFSDQIIGNQRWRVFSHPQNKYRITVAERYDVRNELVYNITRDALYPLVLVLPVLAILIWIAIGQNMRPLNKIAHEVASRSPEKLHSVTTSNHIPAEIEPLISSLNELLERLSMAFDSERRFTADAAHELRTPLASLKTQAQVALRSGDEKELRHALNQVISGADRATHLVKQLLTMARLDPDITESKLETVDLNNVFTTIISDLYQLAVNKDISLNIAEDSKGSVCGYPAALEILGRNLVDNAIRYTPDGGSIDISIEEGDQGTLLVVTDSGPGIPEEERDNVFNRFYRMNRETELGCGLGLSIVYRIAELHRASIMLEAAPSGQGLQVRITFPNK